MPSCPAPGSGVPVAEAVPDQQQLPGKAPQNPRKFLTLDYHRDDVAWVRLSWGE